jgi:hemerythrin-like domain-containing protein
LNIVELLKEDHREAEELIERLEETDFDSDEEEFDIIESPDLLFTQLKAALTLHTQVEEQILYPAMRKFEATADLIPEAMEEHQQVDQILEEMTALSATDQEFQARLEELKDSLAHHIEDEEDELFPKAEELCSAERLEEMGRQMQQLKQTRSKVAATTQI